MQNDQNNQGSSNKMVFIIAGVVAVVVLLYFAFRSGDSMQNPDASLDKVVPAGANDVGTEVRILLAQLNNLSLDTKFFEGEAYKSLMDNTTAVPSQNIGRYKPFEPFDPKNYKTEQIQTSTPRK